MRLYECNYVIFMSQCIQKGIMREKRAKIPPSPPLHTPVPVLCSSFKTDRGHMQHAVARFQTPELQTSDLFSDARNRPIRAL